MTMSKATKIQYSNFSEGNCPWGDFPGGILLVGHFLREQFSRGLFSRGFFPGGIFPDTVERRVKSNNKTPFHRKILIFSDKLTISSDLVRFEQILRFLKIEAIFCKCSELTTTKIEQSNFFLHKMVSRDVFRTLSNIYAGAFFENS